jgi:hypothetical protein
MKCVSQASAILILALLPSGLAANFACAAPSDQYAYDQPGDIYHFPVAYAGSACLLLWKAYFRNLSISTLIAVMCAGVVPQQPPTIEAPAATSSLTRAAVSPGCCR